MRSGKFVNAPLGFKILALVAVVLMLVKITPPSPLDFHW